MLELLKMMIKVEIIFLEATNNAHINKNSKTVRKRIVVQRKTVEQITDYQS
jgi:hypothetical protein